MCYYRSSQGRCQGTSVGGAFKFLGGAQITCVCAGVCMWGGGGDAICGRVQLLSLEKPSNGFLMHAIFSP